MRRVETVMGMPISIDIPYVDDVSHFTAAFGCLRMVDEQFSTYKPESELSQYRSGRKLIGERRSPLMEEVMQACAAYELQTDGYFSAYYDGTFDPTGYVKGWAIEKVSQILQARGLKTYLINAAGDVCAASHTDKRWSIGIQHPILRSEMIGIVTLANGAVATSGTYERGSHIFNPHTKQPTNELVSASVRGSSIVMADVFATACIAMGSVKALGFLENQEGYEALLVDREGSISMTSGFVPSKMQNAQ
jgi:thiamine biosynthesis lipoprotein